MPINSTKADYYRSQIESHERDIALAEQRGRADRADFFRREISITKMLLETTLLYGDDFGSAARNKRPDAFDHAVANLHRILKSGLGPAYYDALRKGRDNVAKVGDPRDPFQKAADLIAALKRAPGEARAAGAAAREAITKAVRADQTDRAEAARIRNLLRMADSLRKNSRWRMISPVVRQHIYEAERAARLHLAKIELKQKARKVAKEAAAKHHEAMVERGVTFSRMM